MCWWRAGCSGSKASSHPRWAGGRWPGWRGKAARGTKHEEAFYSLSHSAHEHRTLLGMFEPEPLLHFSEVWAREHQEGFCAWALCTSPSLTGGPAQEGGRGGQVVEGGAAPALLHQSRAPPPAALLVPPWGPGQPSPARWRGGLACHQSPGGTSSRGVQCWPCLLGCLRLGRRWASGLLLEVPALPAGRWLSLSPPSTERRRESERPATARPGARRVWLVKSAGLYLPSRTIPSQEGRALKPQQRRSAAPQTRPSHGKSSVGTAERLCSYL